MKKNVYEDYVDALFNNEKFFLEEINYIIKNLKEQIHED